MRKTCQFPYKSSDYQRIDPLCQKGFEKTPDLYFSAVANHLSGKEFARDVLGEYLAMDGRRLKFGYGTHGKPFLEDFPDIHFNISHASGAIICAVSDRPVGVDIEKKRKINRRIINKYFTESESNYVFSENYHQDERFTRIWTMKEAYVKYTGKGMHQSFDTFDVFKIQGLITFLYQGYYISVCQRGSN
jgi:4'-phosphopantetheinyl transferase